jgi:hypothetical protein
MDVEENGHRQGSTLARGTCRLGVVVRSEFYRFEEQEQCVLPDYRVPVCTGTEHLT